MIWDIILTCLFIIGVIFIIMYVLFMSAVGETKVYSFKQMNMLFWEFFKMYWGFTNKNS